MKFREKLGNKNTKLLIAVVSLIVIVVGSTFAYFASTYTQSGNNQTVNVSTKSVAEVLYITGSSIEAHPNVNLASGSGNYVIASNQFAIQLKADSSENTRVRFDVGLTNVTNTFVQTENATNDNTYDVACYLYESDVNGIKGNAIASNVDCVKSGTISVKEGANFSTEKNTTKTKYYTLEIELYNANTNDNTNTGKVWSGTINVNNVITEKVVTADGNAILTAWTEAGIPINTTTPSFSSTATSQVGVYQTPDDYGTSYYVRGAANYNFVKFGKDASGNDYWWRIIRINGDGSVRLIYQGTAAPGSTPALTGTSTQINGTPYDFSKDNLYDNNMYVGYKYTSGQRQGLTESSLAKTTLEAWYKTNFVDLAANAIARSYIADRIFCGDRTSSTSSSAVWTTPFTSSGGTSATETYYGAFLRLITAKTPTLICPEAPDKYTTTNANHGNKSLTYPIGLITADEVAMAGGLYDTGNTGYYLYTNSSYLTMSPFIFYSGIAGEWSVNSGGDLNCIDVNTSYGLRAVINLSPESPISGAGTTDFPFVISTNK